MDEEYEHLVAFEVKDGDYTLTITGPLEAIDVMAASFLTEEFEEMLHSQLKAQLEEEAS